MSSTYPVAQPYSTDGIVTPDKQGKRAVVSLQHRALGCVNFASGVTQND
ncbi:MAG: hypothetical protein OXC26_04530 [Albidovulum sp.]|nr:hypothetical protein [Albidovulum sp.]